MNDPLMRQIKCKSPEEIIRVMNALTPELPREVRRQFHTVKLCYVQSFGLEGLYNRVNNRTVAEILALPIEGDLIRTGNLEGTQYDLYAPRDPISNRDESDT